MMRKRAKPRRHADPLLRTCPWKITAVWHPIEQILSRLRRSGEIDVAGTQVVFYEDGRGGWYDMIEAMRGVIQFHEIAASRLNIAVDVSGLVKFANKLEAAMPLFDADLDAVRKSMDSCMRQALNLRLSEALDIIDTVRISGEMEKLKLTQA